MSKFYKINYTNLKGGNYHIINYINSLYENTGNINGIYHKKYDTVYGELCLSEIDKICKEINLNQHDIFYDLGSGSGKIVCYFALAKNIPSIGIEIIDKRHNVANLIQSRINNPYVNFLKGDIFDYNFNNGTIFYAYNLTWGHEINQKVINKIKNEAKNCKYIILSTHENHPNIKLFKEIPNVKFSSHKNSMYIYTLI
tara:strand:+ start:112 stop:705 length:594 start_codon:yes stop_codon:yes gene_type:complete